MAAAKPTLKGVPTSLSFLTMRSEASSCSTTPVAAMRQLACCESSF